MKNVIHVQSRAVILRENNILLCKTTGLDTNFYFLPGGHIEHGESARDSIIRELLEEIGYKFRLVRFLGCFEYSFDPNIIKHAKCHTHEYSFIFEVMSDELPEISSKETIKPFETHIEFEYIPIGNLEKINFRPEPLKSIIPKWLKCDYDAALQTKMASSSS